MLGRRHAAHMWRHVQLQLLTPGASTTVSLHTVAALHTITAAAAGTTAAAAGTTSGLLPHHAWCDRITHRSSPLHDTWHTCNWQQQRSMGKYMYNRSKIERERQRLDSMMSMAHLRVNNDIRAPEVRLVRGDGSHEVMPTAQALEEAQKQRKDLVEVSDSTTPPVCRILHLDEYVQSQRSRVKEQRRKELERKRKDEIKEVRVKPGIAEHDLGIKLANVERFLAKGLKVKLTVQAGGKQRSAIAPMLQVLRERMTGKASITDVLGKEVLGEEDGEPMRRAPQTSLLLEPL